MPNVDAIAASERGRVDLVALIEASGAHAVANLLQRLNHLRVNPSLMEMAKRFGIKRDGIGWGQDGTPRLLKVELVDALVDSFRAVAPAPLAPVAAPAPAPAPLVVTAPAPEEGRVAAVEAVTAGLSAEIAALSARSRVVAIRVSTAEVAAELKALQQRIRALSVHPFLSAAPSPPLDGSGAPPPPAPPRANSHVGSSTLPSPTMTPLRSESYDAVRYDDGLRTSKPYPRTVAEEKWSARDKGNRQKIGTGADGTAGKPSVHSMNVTQGRHPSSYSHQSARVNQGGGGRSGTMPASYTTTENPKQTPKQGRRMPVALKKGTPGAARFPGSRTAVTQKMTEEATDTGSTSTIEDIASGNHSGLLPRAGNHAAHGLHVIVAEYDHAADKATFVSSKGTLSSLASETKLLMCVHRPPDDSPPQTVSDSIAALDPKRGQSQALPHPMVLVVDKDLYESDRFVDLVATEGLPPGCGSPTDPAAPRRLYLLVKDGADRGVGFARHIAKTFAHGIQDVPESSMKRVVMLDDDVILETYKPSEWDRLRQAALPIGRQGPLNQTPGGAAAAAAAADSRPEQTKLTMAEGINLLDDVMDHTQVKPKNTKPAMVVARCEYQVAKDKMTEWVLSFTQAGGGGCMLLDLERCRNASFICRRVRTELSPQAWKNLKDIRATRRSPKVLKSLKRMQQVATIDSKGKKTYSYEPWGEVPLPWRIQLALYQGEDFGIEERLTIINQGYSPVVLHNNLIQKEVGVNNGALRESIAGTLKFREFVDFPGDDAAFQGILDSLPSTSFSA